MNRTIAVAIKCILCALLARTLSARWASASEPIANTVAPGGDPGDDVMRIYGAGGGTGTVIGKYVYTNPQNGDLMEEICLVTANHVVPNGLTQLGYRSSFGGTATNSFNVTPTSSATYHMGPTGTEDMAFIGATVDLSQLTVLQLRCCRLCNRRLPLPLPRRMLAIRLRPAATSISPRWATVSRVRRMPPSIWRPDRTSRTCIIRKMPTNSMASSEPSLTRSPPTAR